MWKKALPRENKNNRKNGHVRRQKARNEIIHTNAHDLRTPMWQKSFSIFQN